MNKTDLWDAINHYCVACGGSPATRIYGNVERQRAVVAVEKAVCETTENTMRKIADAARELLSVTGEIDDDGAFQGCPQSMISIEHREALTPWLEDRWRTLSALVGVVGMRTFTCRGCGGDGQTAQDKPQRCPVCNGSGVEVQL
jgi:rubrerythrin